MATYIETVSVFELEDIIKNKTKTAIIPIGVVEQHGYHLPLGVDMYNTSELLKRCGSKLNAIIMPAVNYSFSGGELTGTININPQIFALFVNEICIELEKIGIKNIIILLGHGGTENRNTLLDSLKTSLRRTKSFDDVAVCLASCWDFSPTWQAGFDMKPEHDFHAGYIETSLMKYWKPEYVKDEIRQDDPEICKKMRLDADWYADEVKVYDHKLVIGKTFQRKEIKIGVMGFPEKAKAEVGKIVCDEMIKNLSDFVEELNKRKPKKI